MGSTEQLRGDTDWIENRLAKADLGEGESRPKIAIVTGSGLGGVMRIMDVADRFGFGEVPGLRASEVVGHDSAWMIGRVGSTPAHILAGRRHLYEGVDPAAAVQSVRLLASLGVRLVVLLNAAGGLHPRLRPGGLMLIRDQINLQFRNPLVGANDDALGTRFPDMSEPYSRPAAAFVRRAAAEAKIALAEGVYAAMLGPTFETPAEVGMLRRLGADVVGMSTVPEVIAARHAGLAVVGISMVTNSHVLAEYQADDQTPHEEVLERAAEGIDRLAALLECAVPRLGLFAGSPMMNKD